MAENEDQKQGKVVTADEQMADLMKEQNGNEVADENAQNGAPDGQGVADNPADPNAPSYTGTKDTSDT